jgi:signal transduction histidine kinase
MVLDKTIGDINSEQIRYLSMVIDNAERLDRLINAVLEYQKLEAGKMVFKMEYNDINEIVNYVQNEMMILFNKKGLFFELDLCDGLPRAVSDRDKLIQVLINLTNNALKFTETGGIFLSTSREDNFIKVTIRDTGVGIQEENMHQLFQEFLQLQVDVHGTGLGLSISKKIIEAHQGKIWAESKIGKGTSFYFTLPVN